MLNKAILMGRLTRDPELRHTQSNIPVASFSLAVERDFASRAAASDGQRQRETDFFDIVAWRGTAEFVSKYFVKGQLVAVCGRLQQRKWTDKDGNNRISVEVIADEVHFAERKNASSDVDPAPYRPAGDYGAPAAPAVAPVSEFAALDDDDGELPF